MPDLPIAYSRNAEKARAIARMFDLGCNASAYAAMEFMLKEREWPDWLRSVAADVDTTKDRPINAEARHGQ